MAWKGESVVVGRAGGVEEGGKPLEDTSAQLTFCRR
jgi:hypothetical protein